jgi:eukaryotic-like serine/threonine-protein kinase
MRHRSERSLVMTLVLAILPAFAQDAPMFRGNLAHTGVYEAVGVTKTPKVKWKFQTGGRLISSPAIVNGTAYIGSFDGSLYAVDAERGAVKWKFETEGSVPSSPAVAGGLVYFGSYDGNFYAVDSATGKKRWSFQTEGERRFAAKNINGILPEKETMPDFWDFYLSSPVVWEGKVYFGSGDGNIYALDATSGGLKWKFKTGNVVHTSPAIANSTLFIGGFDTFFYALNATTGEEKWRYKTGEDPSIHNQEGITSSAAVADGIVYFGCRDSHLYFLEAETGRRITEFFGGGGWISNSPAIKDGKVYFGGGSDGHFQWLDSKTGTAVYSLNIEAGTFASPVIAGNLLYVATFSNELKAFDLTTHNVIWKFNTVSPGQEAAAKSSAKPEPGPLQRLNFYDDRVGDMVNRLNRGIFLSSPVVVRNVVYIASTDGALYALTE